MKVTRFITASALFLMTLVGAVSAQTVEVANTSQLVAAKRQVLAVKYNENNQTTVAMSGTAIAPRVMGKADVEYKKGRTNVRLEMESFDNPQSLGAFYTTYILWAVAPEGQAESLMELPIQKSFKIESTTKFQTFGLIITAEPHSRVELPSSVIVAENTLRKGTEGMITTSKIEYSGDPGTFYEVFSPNSPASNADYNTPLMILGARRAVEIAQRADAKKFAAPELRDAEMKLTTLEQAWPKSRKASDLRDNAKKNSGLAHDVMRIAEQARKLSVERIAEARLSAERQRAGDNIAQAQSEADRARTEAERASTDAVRARIEAERAKASERDQATRAASEAAMARQRVEQAQSETAKAKANEGQARSDADSARLQAEEAKRERDAAQQRLYFSLSEILETRREARGLIVNLSDVLFDTGKATLKPGAREKLSKLAGILSAYPGAYQIEIEGHTDSVGSDESNLNLSRGRAESVRDYMVQNGIKSERVIAARGFGESKPVADNDSPAGRQVNRRVEIIIADQPQGKAKAGNE
ncbi:MAG: OmpA family protein [Acidobacteriota bacterium]|nr:OmpA family protein [Acidobacteriota bacterium]